MGATTRPLVVERAFEARSSLSPRDSRELRRELVFRCGKWDPQTGDHPAWVDFPIVLSKATWSELTRLAETLAEETLAVEQRILASPRACALLGLPRAVRRALWASGAPAPEMFRVMRFDFHPTEEGFCVSEVNSDVPGGFIEASALTRLFVQHFSDCELGADPLFALGDAFEVRLERGARIGLVHATAYTDDRQVMLALAQSLRAKDFDPVLLSPENLAWDEGRAVSRASWRSGRLDALFRFFPAEWLPNLGGRSGYETFFRGARTPACNPAWALISQSKRLAVAARAIDAFPEIWAALQPETRDPRTVPADDRDQWVLKPALGRVGDSIGRRGLTPPKELKAIERAARWFPGEWAAQRWFRAVPLESPHGLVYPCFGVFVVDGRAAGVYGRLSPRPLIDATAQDVPVLVRRDVAVHAEAR